MSLKVTTKESEKQPVLRIRITFDADPTFYSDADPDPDPTFQCDADPDSPFRPSNAPKRPSNDSTFTLWCGIRIRIQLPQMMRIHADPDPQHWKQQPREEIKRINQQTGNTDFSVLPDTLTKNWKKKFGEKKKNCFDHEFYKSLYS